MQSINLLNEQVLSSGIEDELGHLFDGDGVVYLISGFFTYNAFDRFRDNIASFLHRSPNNRLVVIVSTTADQFSPRIKHDLSSIANDDQIRIMRYRDGFMHAKLYVRDGPDPMIILGSANLTRVAMEQNFELCVRVTPDPDELQAIRTFIDKLLTHCEPVRKRDLFKPVMIARTAINWTKKGLLLSPRSLLPDPVRVGVTLMIVTSLWFLLV